MALTPVGPFCPFRSAAAENLNPRMEQLQENRPEFVAEMDRFQLDLQMGNTPDADRLRIVADGIDQAVNQWEDLVTRLRISPDFQTREYAKLTEAHLNSHGQSVEVLGSMMRWQAGCMRAMVDGTPPPVPPPGLDIMKLMAEAQNEERPSPSINAMAAAEQICSEPFKDETVMASPTVKEEYEKLCRDHAALIEFGIKYDSFDPLGKLRFLDEIERIEERWYVVSFCCFLSFVCSHCRNACLNFVSFVNQNRDVFFARFKLMGALNDDYVRQCNQFLESMSMSEDDFRKLLKQAHQMMRSDAEAERRRLSN